MFVEGLYYYLAHDAGILAVLGVSRADGTSGIFPQLAPDLPTNPYVVYQQVSARQVQSYQGMNRLTFARFRFSCYGADYADAKHLAEAIRQAFSSYTGVLNDGSVLQSAEQLMEVDDAEEAVTHGTIHATHLDFYFAYTNVSA